MKKIALMMSALMLATTGWSQDTVQSPVMGNYYLNDVPDLTGGWGMSFVTQWGDLCGIVTKEMTVTGNPVKVYGVAACLVTDDDIHFVPDWVPNQEEIMTDFWAQFRDTTTEECYEYLGIYLRDGDSLVPQREVMVHRRYDTVAYYVETGKMWRYNPDFVYPMYEKYFDESIAVSDTFYVGVTERSLQNPVGVSVYEHMDFMPLAINGTNVNEYHVSKYCWPEEGNVYWDWPSRFHKSDHFYLMFPILTPDPNAPEEPVGPGDTTAISGVDMVSRYVTVQPNPAEEEARVLSSFGLQRIEAFDGGGRQMLDVQAEGMQAVLDVRGWAGGTYLLRITTPLGTATKKLIVR